MGACNSCSVSLFSQSRCCLCFFPLALIVFYGSAGGKITRITKCINLFCYTRVFHSNALRISENIHEGDKEKCFSFMGQKLIFAGLGLYKHMRIADSFLYDIPNLGNIFSWHPAILLLKVRYYPPFGLY